MTLKTSSTSPPQHRADLAGSVVARGTLRRYIEILYGFLLGLLMWVMDAAMHTRLAGGSTSAADLLNEVLRPGSTPTLFRGSYLIVATILGWALWRANIKREAEERQQREQALATERVRAILAVLNTFRKDLNNPLALITATAQKLAERFPSGEDQFDEIIQSALSLSSLIKSLANSAPLYIVDASGVERIIAPGISESSEGEEVRE